MSEAVVVADVHEGIQFGYRVDPVTGISERAMDFHRNFVAAARWAIDHGSKLFIIAGDLFDRTNVSPAFREMVRRDVVEPLGQAGVKVWLLAGNHDQPRIAARSTSLDDFRGYKNVEVFKDPTVRTFDFDGHAVGFILLPYLHPERLLDMVREQMGQELPREHMHGFARQFLAKWMAARVAELEVPTRVLLGHYWLEGARITSTYFSEVDPGEFTLTRDMIPPAVDLTVLGHIHLHQALGPRVVYPGAPERIDWGERDDPKGFLSLTPSAEWEFHPLPTREMLAIDVDAREGDPTEKVLGALPDSLVGKMVRLRITVRPGGRAAVDQAAVDARLAQAFEATLRWNEEERLRVGVTEYYLDPLKLFEEFVTNNYGEDVRQATILEEGRRILQEVLA